MSVEANKSTPAPMSSLDSSWTSISLQDALRKGTVVMKENADGKADCWKKFRLLETNSGDAIFGWAACVDCYSCIMFKSRPADGKTKLYGTKNMTDHMKSCAATSGRQLSMAAFMKRVPGKNLASGDKVAVKNAQVRLVVEAGLSFAVVENPAFLSFAERMISIGSKYGNVSPDEVLFGRQTVRETVFQKMVECQEEIKKAVAASSANRAVSFCTDMTTDDVNKNSYSDFTVFWVDNWLLHHSMYKCEYFPEKHTAQNIRNFIDSTLMELGLSLTDTPCTTDKGSNIVAATAAKTHVDCSCHRLNTAIDTGWKNVMSLDADVRQLDNFCHELVKYANQASGVQSNLPKSLKHGGETRPWRSLTDMFSSISASRDALVPLLRERKKEQLIARIDVDLLHEVVSFVKVFPPLFDVLEYANIPTLQNSLPVYYTLHEVWQPQAGDSEPLALMKKAFLAALTDKYWTSLSMLNFVASYLDPTLRDFAFVRNVNDRQGFFRQVKEGIHSLASELTPSNVNEPGAALTSHGDNFISEDNASVESLQPKHKKLKADPFNWFRQTEASSSTSTQAAEAVGRSLKDMVDDELKDYGREVIPAAAPADFDPLRWWGERVQKYPLLSDIARRIFVIPASSAECERHFSALNARHIITAQRNKMYPETVQALSVVLEGYKNKLIK